MNMCLRIVQLVVASVFARWSLAAALPDEKCDVLVVGGGPAGVAAALQSARAGAKTILLEQGFQVGGTMTTGGTQYLAKGAGNYVSTTIDKIYGKE